MQAKFVILPLSAFCFFVDVLGGNFSISFSILKEESSADCGCPEQSVSVMDDRVCVLKMFYVLYQSEIRKNGWCTVLTANTVAFSHTHITIITVAVTITYTNTPCASQQPMFIHSRASYYSLSERGQMTVSRLVN